MHKRIVGGKVWLSVEIEVEGLEDAVDIGQEMGDAFDLCWTSEPSELAAVLHAIQNGLDALLGADNAPFAADEVLNTIDNYMDELEKSEEE